MDFISTSFLSSRKHHFVKLLRTAVAVLVVLAVASTAKAADTGLVLWNRLGSSSEVLNSAVGPNLQQYTGGSWPDVAANAAFGPGVLGNAITIGPGSYSSMSRVHNVVFDNLNEYLNSEAGAVDFWYKQMADPVPYQSGIFRLFDGGFGLGSGMGIESDTDGLVFSLTFGGTTASTSCGISAYNGTWINVAGVWDRAGIEGSADKLRLYVNGRLVGVATNATWGSSVGSQADIAGAQDGNCAGQFYLDELRVYNRALSASEVMDLYTNQTPTPTPPAITSQPQSQTVQAGANVTLTVAATGAPLYYQWLFNGTNLPGARASTLSLNPVGFSNAGVYLVIVSNSVGVAVSSNASLTVNLPVTSTNGLVLWNTLGSSSELLNSAFGPNLLKYTGGSWPDAAANAAFGPGVQGTAITIGPGSYSSMSRVHNVVFDHLNEYLNSEAGAVDFWYKQMADPVPYQSGIFRLFDGGFGLGSGMGIESDTDGLVFSLTFGGTTTSTSFDISEFNGTWLNVAGVWDRAGIEGSADKLRLYVNGRLVGVATNATWGSSVGSQADIAGAQDGNCAGQFYLDELRVYNRALSASEVSELYTGQPLTPTPPVIKSHPQSQTVPAGANVTLAVVATGAPLYYQWLFNGTNLPGATASTLSFNPVELSNAGVYSVIVSNSAGVAVSSNAWLAVSSVVTSTNGLVFWNTLGSDLEASHSLFGPGLQKYTGGSWPDAAANAAYGSGVDGNALTIGPGSYSSMSRVHNMVFDNLNRYLNSDKGTIACWYKQMANPVPYQSGIFRLFDGGFGFDSGLGLECSTDGLVFGLTFGGTTASASCNISAYNGTWINVAGVWDRAGIEGSADKLRLYVNGRVVGAVTSATWGTTVGSRADIAGAQDGNCAGQFYMDDLKVFNRALSTEEVQANYTARGASQAPTVLEVSPPGAYVNEGASVLLGVTVLGSPSLTYQWQHNGTNLPGATDSALSLSNVRYAQAGNYAVVVSNPVATSTSSNVLLRINRAPVADASATATVNISPDGASAVVVLDGSRSSDPDGDGLTYAWSLPGQATPLATSVVAIQTLPVGTNQVLLCVNDGMASGTRTLWVEVLTTLQAVDRLMELVQAGAGNNHPLVVSLRAAVAAIDRSQPQTAINQLETFINKVHVRLEVSDPELAAQLITDAQAIIDALNGGSPSAPEKLEITSIGHTRDNQSHLRIKGLSGRIHVVETSANLVDWVPVGVATNAADGTYDFDDSQAQQAGTRFYRVVSPK